MFCLKIHAKTKPKLKPKPKPNSNKKLKKKNEEKLTTKMLEIQAKTKPPQKN